MNLIRIKPKNETEYLLLSFTKNCKILVNITSRGPEEILEFNLNNQMETFHFKPPF